ncbi:DNA oxidative demethylase AlkB [Aquitalea sp.]|jgi:alkylated DNA repair protein (DNA oxidative demethylase)|uniref:DNA oxidative demethylase AlkB n=1 Tax=Aquitalea sp. TaxID=1872623 RepID=UPI0025860752|nr:DNA oxidative demethylase AlkB [Aquitalea sp.]
MQDELFPESWQRPVQQLSPGITLLPGLALEEEKQIWQDVQAVLQQAALRQMQTPGGRTMSVSMSNCGALGWVSGHGGYRYSPTDPDSGLAWPAMPPRLAMLASQWAAAAGFNGFDSNACLINCYVPGCRMSLHQDRDERDFSQPIVTLSLGLPARFMLGGIQRNDACQIIPLIHGDVLVFGGPARLCFHGIMPLTAGAHPLLGSRRISLTFRRA